MDLSKVDMKALAEILNIASLEGYELRNDDPDDGELVLSRADVGRNVCKDNYVLMADGKFVYTRQCSCPDFFGEDDSACSEFFFQELKPLESITAGLLLAALGEKVSGDFTTMDRRRILYMQNRLGLRNDYYRLGIVVY